MLSGVARRQSGGLGRPLSHIARDVLPGDARRWRGTLAN